MYKYVNTRTKFILQPHVNIKIYGFFILLQSFFYYYYLLLYRKCSLKRISILFIRSSRWYLLPCAALHCLHFCSLSPYYRCIAVYFGTADAVTQIIWLLLCWYYYRIVLIPGYFFIINVRGNNNNSNNNRKSL